MKISLRLVLLVLVLAVTTLLLLPFQLIAMRFFPRQAGLLPMVWQRVAAFMLDLKVRVEGVPAPGRPLLIVANHVSWLDIVTLGSLMPVSFIAKREVSEWPVVRRLARLQRSVFIDRARRTATAEAGEAIATRLASGDALVLFAEGTTGDGVSVLPFRSALVGAAAKASIAARKAEAPPAESGLTSEAGAPGDETDLITIQPVAIVYAALHGLPIGRLRMTDIAWHGDMDLAPHLSSLVATGAIDAVVAFGTPLVLRVGGDRKQATATAEREVRAMVRRIRATGRGPKPAA